MADFFFAEEPDLTEERLRLRALGLEWPKGDFHQPSVGPRSVEVAQPWRREPWDIQPSPFAYPEWTQ